MNNLQVLNSQQEIIIQNGFNEDLGKRWINFIDASPKTIETYSRAIKQFFKYIAYNGINNPMREDVLAYKDELKATNHKPTTIQNYITAIKIFFEWTAQEGLYPNIAEHIKGAKLNREHKKDHLTSGQVKTILQSIDRSTPQGLRDYAIFSLVVAGGLRTVEVSRANIEDLRPLGEKTVLYIQGKGREEKTDYIIIEKPIERIIREYLKSRTDIEETAPLFVSLSKQNKGQRLTTRTISGSIKTAMRNAGYDSERLTAHSLRHTAITLSLLAGKDITEVQQFARHSNINTTMIYNHALEKVNNSCGMAIAEALF